MSITRLGPAEADAVVDVLCDAFHDYPVMRYVLGDVADYDRRLRTLVGFFVAARVLRAEPMLAVHDGGVVAGVAIVALPGGHSALEALESKREETWRDLGAAERARYEAFGATTKPFMIEAPHHHLSMIGVRHSHHGRGMARLLLEAVHGLAEADPASAGVSLSTETRRNVPLYEHFGYRVLGHARVDDELETWVFFRPRRGRPAA